MADTRPIIKNFTGVDFDVWEMSLRALLTIHQVSHVLNKAPTKMTTDKVNAWKKAQNLAFSHALLTLDEVHKHKVSKTKTVVEILAILRSEYQSITTKINTILKNSLVVLLWGKAFLCLPTFQISKTCSLNWRE